MTEHPKAACCRAHASARAHLQLSAKALPLLGARSPRQVAQYVAVNGRGGRAALELGALERCPCHDSPHPEIFRRMFDAVAGGANLGAALDAAADGLGLAAEER